MDNDKEIEIIGEGLKRYPNSADLKLYLAFSLSMVNRISKDNGEKREAVQKAIKEPRDIDKNLVDAQQARRVLDRIVGYKISPVLWKKVKRGLSAGRVQSVAVKLIVDREEEIEKFIPEEYWNIYATLLDEKSKMLCTF